MVQTKVFSLLENTAKMIFPYLNVLSRSLFFLLKSSKVLTWYNWFKLNGKACECNTWGQTGCALSAVSMPMPFLLHHLCVAVSTENSPRCSVTISLPKSWVCCELLQRSESTFEFLRRSGLFRTVINAFCFILPGCLLGGLFHPNSSWPLKVGLSHRLNRCFDSCCFFFPRIFAWDKGKQVKFFPHSCTSR